jgi:hypothetical protein
MSTRTILGAVLACALLLICVATSSAYASASFGIERYAVTASEKDASSDTQAGSHPYELTAEAVLDPNAHSTSEDEVKNLDFELPPGLIVNPTAVSLCTYREFTEGECPGSAAVAVAKIRVAGTMQSTTVYNLAPAPGEFARLGLTIEGDLVIAGVSVRTGGDYGMTLSIQDLPQLEIESVKLTLGGLSSSTFLTLPTSCASSPHTTLHGESWGGEAASLSTSLPQLTGCNRLPFAPTLSVVPDTAEAGEPTGYYVRLSLPQTETPEGLATALPENASVTLPAGASLSLLSMSNSSGCGEAQVALDSGEPAMCPNASKIGLVKIGTPLLAHPLEGAMFLATPNANPLGALVAVYVVAEEAVSGVRLELAGQIDLNPVTGQPTLTFEDLPQLPIGEIDLEQFGGERTLMVNPPSCGPATSIGHLKPWSGSGEAEASSSFDVSWNGAGGECPDPLPFEPSLNAGTVSTSAGSYSPFILAVSRGDRQQALSGLQVQLPPGLEWMLGSVAPCGEPQAGQGTCPQASQIGTAIIRGGPANTPASFTGSVYLTEGYNGAQYGLSISFNAVAGPFDLGTLVLRAALAQNPSTGALTITSGPLPQLIDGVPLQTRALELDIDRHEFVLNPTVCESRQITATIEGSQGTSVQASNPFAVQGCENPPMDGDSSVGTEEPAGDEGAAGPGKHGAAASRADGVSLDGSTISVQSSGTALLKLACAGMDTCTGKLALTVKTKNKIKHRQSKTTTIGTATFSIPAGKSRTVVLRLTAVGKKMLAHAGKHHPLAARLVLSVRGGKATSRSVLVIWALKRLLGSARPEARSTLRKIKKLKSRTVVMSSGSDDPVRLSFA